MCVTFHFPLYTPGKIYCNTKFDVSPFHSITIHDFSGVKPSIYCIISLARALVAWNYTVTPLPTPQGHTPFVAFCLHIQCIYFDECYWKAHESYETQQYAMNCDAMEWTNINSPVKVIDQLESYRGSWINTITLHDLLEVMK
jgi:hypothetical protein